MTIQNMTDEMGPNARDKRITGADVTIQLFKGDVLQDRLALVKDCSVTFAAGDDGEQAMRAVIEFSAHMEDMAYMDFIDGVTVRGERFSAAVSILAPNGDARMLMLKDLMFAAIKVSIGGRHDLVEARFTVLSESYKFIDCGVTAR